MIRSMTGFARQEEPLPDGHLACEIKTVNHRYLEVSLRLPDELRSQDGVFRQMLGRTLRRGKVDCNFNFRSSGSSGPLELDASVLEAVLRTAKQVALEAGDSAQMNVTDLLRWPGVIVERSKDIDALHAAARRLLDRSIAELGKFRDAEGARLRQALDDRVTQLGTLADVVERRLPEVRARIRAKWIERIAQLGVTVDEGRLEQELALQAQRLDVDEEIERLRGHLIEVRKTLGAPEAAGRRLDFLMQELNREANTLSSKSQDLDTTRAAVDMKVLIEQMREQVQNIE